MSGVSHKQKINISDEKRSVAMSGHQKNFKIPYQGVTVDTPFKNVLPFEGGVFAALDFPVTRQSEITKNACFEGGLSTEGVMESDPPDITQLGNQGGGCNVFATFSKIFFQKCDF